MTLNFLHKAYIIIITPIPDPGLKLEALNQQDTEILNRRLPQNPNTSFVQSGRRNPSR